MGPVVALLYGLQVAGVLLLLLHTYGWSVAARNRRKSLDRLRLRRSSSTAKQPLRATRKRGAQQPGGDIISTDDGDYNARATAIISSGSTTGSAENSRCPHWPAVAVVMPVRGFHAHTASNWATHITADYAGPVEFLIVVESEVDRAYLEACKLAARFNAEHKGGREGGAQGKQGRVQKEEGRGHGGAGAGEGKESIYSPGGGAVWSGEVVCEGETAKKSGVACRQQGEVHLRKVHVVVAGTSTTCSQKIHNQLAAVDAARPEAEFVLFLDDDARMYPEAITYLVTDMLRRPDTFLVTGYPFDIPNPGSLFSYAVLGFHLVPLVNFSYDAGTEYIWGGCMMLRLGDFRSNRLGMVDVLRKGGYSDDMTLGAVGNSIRSSSGNSSNGSSNGSSIDRKSSSKACQEESSQLIAQECEKREQQSGSSVPCRALDCAQRLRLSSLEPNSLSTPSSPSTPGSSDPPMLSPAYALLAHPLDPHFSAIQFWSYLRRQLFALTTYFSPLNCRLNLWLLLMGMAFSSVMVGSMAVSLSFLVQYFLPWLVSSAAVVLAGIHGGVSLVAAAPVCNVPVVSVVCRVLPFSAAAIATSQIGVAVAGGSATSGAAAAPPPPGGATAAAGGAAGAATDASPACPSGFALAQANTTCSILSVGILPEAVSSPAAAAAAAAAAQLSATNNTLGVYLKHPALLLPLLPSLLHHTITHLSHLPLAVSLALLHFASFALASLALRAMIAAHIQTCCFLDPQAPFFPDRAAVAVVDGGKCDCREWQYALWRVWVGYLIHNSMYPFCALLTCWVPYIDWAGIRYKRRAGRITRD
ncbi:unnamed protein product [Closterium sp. NIES-53]